MKIREIITENTDLFELKMSPRNLRQLAAGIDARAGMEFELAFPDLDLDTGDGDLEPDYDQDQRTGDISDILDFFNDGDFNSRREIQNLEGTLREEYSEWASEQFDRDWNVDAEQQVRDYIEANYDPDQDNIEELVADALENQNSDYENARDEYQESWEWPDEGEWLRSRGLRYMSDIESRYDVSWPHYTTSESSEGDIQNLADDFSNNIGKPVNTSTEYHGAEREPGAYAVEPDSSITPDGLEFVSPPMPVSEMFSDLRQVFDWAQRQGAKTNKSTGLHINISVANYSQEKLDYVKLALLLGDEYVLNQFGRLGNTYTRSALDIIRKKISASPEAVQSVLTKMKQGLDAIATRLIHSGVTDKYTSINTKDGYVEFRAPGGDYLSLNLDQIENTLLRFVIALDAALDPTKYRKEYLAKLYKLLTPADLGPGAQDTIMLFAKNAAGEIDKRTMMAYLRQKQLQKSLAKPPKPGQKYVWKVHIVNRPFPSLEVLAATEVEANQLAGMMAPEWERYELTARPMTIYRPGASAWYRVSNNQGQAQRLQATSETEALQRMRLSMPDLFGVKPGLQVTVEPI